ncbi:MAG TPA: acetate kinase [Polyangiaceae bacterium]|nr:acetate kinase [Polyangiaceae bacterium]
MQDSVILVINCGSSSLKFAAIEPRTGNVRCQGIAERLNSPEARLEIEGAPDEQLDQRAGPVEVLERIRPLLTESSLAAVGHRVVHGGERFSDSVLVNEQTMAEIEACIPLAPLHNPANLAGIRSALTHFAELPHVAVFDTAFHQTLPSKAYMYAIPYELYERHRVRRYGFHGSSHRYVAAEAARLLGRPESELQLVTAHLGNGCSTCAIRAGQSVDTSMGLTPLEGLVMGTRSGDVDPNLHEFLAEQTGKNLTEITRMFNRDSGLYGLSGLSNDMRTLLAAAGDNPRARLAIDVFCYRLARSILGLCAGLERLDALIFTGGIGEHAAAIRATTLAELAFLGAKLDPALNETHGEASAGRITHESSRLLALVVPTNEELVIAREAARFAQQTG